jgi:regulator of sirC expression with transglutaminase-like and TPR domain
LQNTNIPKLNFEDVEEKLNKIINDLRLEINLYLTGLQQIRKINHILYNIHRFSGDFSNIINPENSYVNKVLEKEKKQ